MKTPRPRTPKPPTKSWILAEMLAERPCYPETQVRALYGTRARLTLRQILLMTQVPVADRLWVTHRPNACTPAQYAAWCERFVTRAVQRHINNPIPAVATWAQRWMSGEDRSAEVAAVAAESLAWSASRVALAAGRAASAEVEAAVWASWAAGSGRSAEQSHQLHDLLAVLREGR